MSNNEILATVKKDPTFSYSVGGSKVRAWRKKGGYILLWKGFEFVAPRNQKPTEPYFAPGSTKSSIINDFKYSSQ